MKTNKKGFTMVELLGVIIILSVIILIAVTAVIPRMNNAKKTTFVDEALMYLKAGKEVYVSGEAQECYNVADFGDYVKQEKEGYSGTIYINDDRITLNLTNGKYYIITSGNPNLDNVSETKPANFVTSCTDTSSTYAITYDLGGGTLSSSNPTSYGPNTSTFTLNNPTKSGYRFVGWSSKNILKPYSTYYENTYYKVEYKNGEWVINGERASGSSNFIIFEETLPAGTYYINGIPGGAGDTFQLAIRKDGSVLKYVKASNTTFTLTQPAVIRIQLYLYSGYGRFENVRLKYQLEQDTSVTDYQSYMDPTTEAKIYRGSTGNKKFIANWEAI